MHIIFIVDPKSIQKNGKPLCWREWISDATDAACAIKDHKLVGRLVERFDYDKHMPLILGKVG